MTSQSTLVGFFQTRLKFVWEYWRNSTMNTNKIETQPETKPGTRVSGFGFLLPPKTFIKEKIALVGLY